MADEVKMYDMHIRVAGDVISTIIGVLTGAGEVIKIEPTGMTAEISRSHKKGGGTRTRITHHVKPRAFGILGKDLLKQILQEGPKTLEQITKVFTDRGFAPTSPSPLISKYRKERKIIDEDGGIIRWRG
jgi:hypothetical protein